jgi:WD40 repeat protein
MALNEKLARIFEANTGRELLVLSGHISSVREAVFSPDGAKVATGSWDNTVRLWDAMTGAELLTLRGHADSVRRVVFSPDGQRLFSVAQDSKVNTWDVATGRLLSTLSGGNNALAISPDGRRLVTGSFSGSVRLWDATTGELLAEWNARGAVPVLDFSPDGRRLLVVTTDPNAVLIKPNLEIWEAETGRPLLVMPEDSAVFSARFSPDGHRFLSGSFYASAARIWEAFPWEERFYHDAQQSRSESGEVRPSPGAGTFGGQAALGRGKALVTSRVSAPEDGRTIGAGTLHAPQCYDGGRAGCHAPHFAPPSLRCRIPAHSQPVGLSQFFAKMRHPRPSNHSRQKSKRAKSNFRESHLIRVRKSDRLLGSLPKTRSAP